MHRVVALALPNVVAFDLSVPAQVFGRYDGPYSFEACAPRAGRVPTTTGFAVLVDRGLDAIRDADTVIVPGFDPPSWELPDAVLDALRAAHARGARVGSICTGAFALAAAGLLDGRRATTHWAYAQRLARMHPKVELDAGVLYVDEGDVVTSAGVAAGIDLCLHLVRRDVGAEAANAIARQIVVAPHRDGGQAQFVDAPLPAADERGLAPRARGRSTACASRSPSPRWPTTPDAASGPSRAAFAPRPAPPRCSGCCASASCTPAACSRRQTCRSRTWPARPASAPPLRCARTSGARPPPRRWRTGAPSGVERRPERQRDQGDSMATTRNAAQGILADDNTQPREHIIDLLKKAYWMEIETVMSYIANSVNPDGVRAQEIVESLQQDIQEELGHAQQFAARIKELYGVVPGSLEFSAEQSYLQPPAHQTDIVHIIKGVIEAETGAIEHYNRIIQETDDIDPVTQDMVIAILRDEEGHRRLFEGYLREYEAEGLA
jgi:bacterioferritin